MDSIGDFFKQVRETKGLTVDEVASKPRIRADFVKALEEGNLLRELCHYYPERGEAAALRSIARPVYNYHEVVERET